MNTPTILTERLILRRFTPEDLEALFLILKEEETNRFLPWYPVKDLKETETFLNERYFSVYKELKGYAYAICLKEDNFPIGYMKIDTKEPYDFGYGLRKDFWHKGITTEAGKALLKRIEKDGIPFVTATHDVNNPRSGKVMERLGMKYCYSYKEQWQPKDFPVIFRMYQLNFNVPEDFIYTKYYDEATECFVEEL